jgi:hypothetical protein
MRRRTRVADTIENLTPEDRSWFASHLHLAGIRTLPTWWDKKLLSIDKRLERAQARHTARLERIVEDIKGYK